jgi:hypothetical protein
VPNNVVIAVFAYCKLGKFGDVMPSTDDEVVSGTFVDSVLAFGVSDEISQVEVAVSLVEAAGSGGIQQIYIQHEARVMGP